MQRTLYLAVVIGLAACHLHAHQTPATNPSDGKRTWEFRDGRWPEITAPTPQQPRVDEELVRIEQLVKQRRAGEAKSRLIRWFADNRSSPVYDQALFLMAESLIEEGDRLRAFYYFDQLLDEYPDSRLFAPALERQYDIANVYLDGAKDRFAMLPIVGRKDEAVEMLFRIQQRSPGSPIAQRALRRTADFYYTDRQYDLAADVYGAYLRAYPRSPDVPLVRMRQAFANYAQFRGEKFDATPIVDARAQLLDVIGQYPEFANQENLAALVQQIDNEFAEKLAYTARFYERTKKFSSAVYTYRYLIRSFPNSPQAQDAKAALARMPASALEQPEPGRGFFGLPSATQPMSDAQR
jgi:outer membrane assembly lipoprotein YfiO